MKKRKLELYITGKLMSALMAVSYTHLFCIGATVNGDTQPLPA